MARVPVITSPCPFRWSSAPKPGQDFCGQCERRVHNLDAMSAGEREAFFAACTGEVCVAYSVRRPVRAAVVLSAGVVAAVALAGSASADAPAEIAAEEEGLVEIVVTGGTVTGDNLQWVDASEAALPDKPDLPEITVVEWLPAPEA